MAIKNIKGLLTQATALPAAIEGKLPEGAPKVSTMLLDAAARIPAVPDFPVEIPDLPAPPELPAVPGAELRRYVTGVEVTPVGERPPAPTLGAPKRVIERRGM